MGLDKKMHMYTLRFYFSQIRYSVSTLLDCGKWKKKQRSTFIFIFQELIFVFIFSGINFHIHFFRN